MLLVILGAGASADSVQPDAAIPGESQGWRPPLADELFAPRFHDMLIKRGGAVVLAERVRTGMSRGETLEQVLARLQADTSDPRRAGQVLDLQYYFEELLWNCSARWNLVDAGMSNYLTLVNELEDWRVQVGQRIVYVTFNYDMLLEYALTRRFGWNFADVADYLRADYAVIKVHGSANWLQVTDYQVPEGTGLAAWKLIEAAAELVRTDNFIVAGPGTTQYGLSGAVPAIAVPAEPKAGFVCPSLHLQALERALSDVEHILCIGWRGADRNLLDLMRGRFKSPVGVTVVTQQPPNGVAGILDSPGDWPAWVGEAGGADSCDVVRSGFSRFVRDFLPGFVASLSSLPSGRTPPDPLAPGASTD
jgi:hypothetical protein